MRTPKGAADSPERLARVTEILLYLLFVAALVLGGGHLTANVRVLLLCIIASTLLGFSAMIGAGTALSRLPLLLRVSLIMIPLVPLAQLLPLPPSLWAGLPGRDAPAAIFQLVGAQDEWHPISLTPRNTLFSLLLLLPPYAAFIAATTLGARARARSVIVFLAASGLSVAVGIIQVATHGAALDFFGSSHRGNLIGFFANRNHQGVMLAIAACFSIAAVHRHIRPWQAAATWSAILSVTFLALVVGTTSRAALGLTALSLAMICYIQFLSDFGRKRPLLLIGLAIGTLLVVYFLSYSRVVDQALTRFNDVKDDGRWEIWEASWPLVRQYFPWGSGIGSFIPAFAAVENIDSLTPYYVNHAHNDYLEILIEGGILGVLALVIFMLAIGTRAAAVVFRKRELPPFGAPAGIALLVVGLHSVVDYPLRTEAIAVLFAIILAIFFADPAEKTRVRTRIGSREENVR